MPVSDAIQEITEVALLINKDLAVALQALHDIAALPVGHHSAVYQNIAKKAIAQIDGRQHEQQDLHED